MSQAIDLPRAKQQSREAISHADHPSNTPAPHEPLPSSYKTPKALSRPSHPGLLSVSRSTDLHRIHPIRYKTSSTAHFTGASMDSDYCLICDKKTLGGIYCSQTCRLLDLESTARGLHDHTHFHQESSLTAPTSNNTSPAASPQFAPTRSSNLPSLPILNSLDRYINRSSSFSTSPKRPVTMMQSASTAQTPSENTSIWRRRSILFYTT